MNLQINIQTASNYLFIFALHGLQFPDLKNADISVNCIQNKYIAYNDTYILEEIAGKKGYKNIYYEEKLWISK